jgi:UDP-N-acetylglucosamine--N-acetylmuramyl-(pentapeptide) pyrophosphoryl-undecaprenol N-acetylglucosamine transferase
VSRVAQNRPALIMAGGTGGHVFPALALARLLRQREVEVVWLGTRRGLEARIVPAEPLPIEWLAVGGLRGKGPLTVLAAPFRVAFALLQALGVMLRRRPFVVVGLGGFVTGPGGLAAWLMRRPLVIHEQNAIAGFTNRCLANLAREVLEAFPGSFGAGVRARTIGNPVRQDIVGVRTPAERFAERTGPIRILVIGGSQGAVRLNTIVPLALAALSRQLAAARVEQAGSPQLEIRHQAGSRWHEAAERSYAGAGVRAEVTPFIDDMAAAYAWADLVICRSGALTVSELAAAGVGAILVPFPAAVDDHQTANARYLVNAGAAVLIADRELSAERLAAELAKLCNVKGPDGARRGTLLGMAERARALALPQAAEDLAAACLRYAAGAA